ncbi:hypothetical protein D1007_19585 [Hordeum vulgare]|nr:hypothetical protein D1007_19585 [Hordeum vulgare]
MKKRGPRAGAAPRSPETACPLPRPARCGEVAGRLLHPVPPACRPPLRYLLRSCLEALRELEAVGAGAPVDYLRTYVPDLGDHRTLEQLRRMISFASSCCSRSWPQGGATLGYSVLPSNEI